MTIGNILLRNMADQNRTSGVKSPSYDQNAIFFELSPKLVLLVRTINVLVLFMVGLSTILCIVQAHKENGSFYLLICNLVLSGIVCVIVNWWYRTGDLGSEKYWYILLVGAVILLQCVMTDIFIYKTNPSPHPTPPVTTHRPNSTVTFPWTSMKPVTQKRF